MGLIRERFPGLSFVHLGELVEIVVGERNAASALNQVYDTARWGLACLCCNVVRDRIRSIAAAGSLPWLRYLSEVGMAYTVVVDDVPLRIQPDVEEIRGMMNGELQVQTLLFGASPGDPYLLRLEVDHPAGREVRGVALYLFDESSGKILDKEPLYVAGAHVEDATTAAPSDNVVPMERDAQTPDISDFFEFPVDEDDAKKDDLG